MKASSNNYSRLAQPAFCGIVSLRRRARVSGLCTWCVGEPTGRRWTAASVFVCALLASSVATAQCLTHAPWPADWSNWSDPALWVTVGNPGNAPDMQYFWYDNYPTPVGSVGYSFRMAKFDVTAGQYAVFLNAVAKSDPFGLYDPGMDVSFYDRGCNIRRSGPSGAYCYTVAPGWATRPVNMVTWGSAARFCNWLTNGQPTTGVEDRSTTEDGSYPINGATTNVQLMAVTRSPTARYVLPTGDEWYKAAFHKNDGITGDYWNYATGTDVRPSNLLADPDPGNSADFYSLGYAIGAPYWRTEVGEFENSPSPYGTFDQAGNIRQWTESSFAGHRGLGGGGFEAVAGQIAADFRDDHYPSSADSSIGFRIAEVPEPASLCLLAAGGILLVRRRGR